MRLQIKKLYPDAVIPERAHRYDSGMDIFSYLDKEYITVAPGERVLVPTGIALKLPEPEYFYTLDGYTDGSDNFVGWKKQIVYELQLRPKSGLALKQGITVLNTPGTIDSTYIGHVQVIVINHSKEDVVIKHQQKIAQLVLCPVFIPEIEVVEELEATDRGSAGFGSTGV